MKVASLSDARGDRPATKMRDTSGQDRSVERQPRLGRKLWLGVAAVAAVALLLILVPVVDRYLSTEKTVSRQRLRLAQVQHGDFLRDVSAQGRVVAAVSPTIFAPADGTVTLMLEAGDTVEEGEVIARVTSPVLSNEREREAATLASLDTGLERLRIDNKKRELENQQTVDLALVTVTAAERELRRAESSKQFQVISEQDYEKAVDDLARAKLEYEHAQQNALLESESLAFDLRTKALELDRQRLVVSELERRVANLEIRSPVSGIVGNLAVDQKAAVAENTPLLTVVDLTALEVEVQVPESYADNLVLGMDAEVTFGAETYAAMLTAVSPEVQNSQVTSRVRFTGAPPAGLRQNQRVTARIVLESIPNALTVQRGAFYDSGAGRVAYVVRDGVAVRRPIRTGSTSVSAIEIIDGLTAGETIIVSSISQFDGAETVLVTD